MTIPKGDALRAKALLLKPQLLNETKNLKLTTSAQKEVFKALEALETIARNSSTLSSTNCSELDNRVQNITDSIDAHNEPLMEKAIIDLNKLIVEITHSTTNKTIEVQKLAQTLKDLLLQPRDENIPRTTKFTAVKSLNKIISSLPTNLPNETLETIKEAINSLRNGLLFNTADEFNQAKDKLQSLVTEFNYTLGTQRKEEVLHTKPATVHDKHHITINDLHEIAYESLQNESLSTISKLKQSKIKKILSIIATRLKESHVNAIKLPILHSRLMDLNNALKSTDAKYLDEASSNLIQEWIDLDIKTTTYEHKNEVPQSNDWYEKNEDDKDEKKL